jgi:hypothetical protein
MPFKPHPELEGKHAFLSPSKYHWIRYDTPTLELRFARHRDAQRGTDLHLLAHEAIRLGVELHESNGALAEYVKDGIEFGMSCEVALFYSWNCYGSADTMSFRKKFLRIHDLKNGVTPAKFDQLKVYAALYCLEYEVYPYDIEIELRIYQNEVGTEPSVFTPEPEEIEAIMRKIVDLDAHIESLKEG